MRQFTVSETHYQVLQAQVTVLHITMQQAALEPLHLDLAQAMIPVDCVSYQAQYTMGTLTLDTLEKTGVQEVTGHAYHGKTHWAMSQVILQQPMITAGTRMQQRLSFQFLTKALKTATQHNKLMTSLLFRKHTTVALTLE